MARTRELALPWRQQPQEAVRPAEQYADMHAAFIGGQTALVGAAGGVWTPEGTPVAGVSPFGRTTSAPSYATAGRWLAPQIPAGGMSTWPGITVVVALRAADLADGDYPAAVSILPVGAGQYYGCVNLTVERPGVRSIYWRVGDSPTNLTPTVYGSVPGADEWTPGDELVIVARWDKLTSRIAVRRNGAVRRNSAGHSYGWQSVAQEVAVGGYVRSGYRMSEHQIALAAIVQRDVGADAEAELLGNPWALFAPRRILVPTYSAPGAVPDITFVGAENILATSADYRVSLNYA